MIEREGSGHSRWQGREMLDALAMLRSVPGVIANGNASALTAEFPYHGGMTSLLRVHTDIRHPIYGAGLHVTLALPETDGIELVRKALQYNEAESSSDYCHQSLGSWCVQDGMLVHVCFIPNFAHVTSLQNNIQYTMRRAQWASEVPL